MKIHQALPGLADGAQRISLLDVDVESIQYNPHMGSTDRVRKRESLVAPVDEIGLEAIDRLDPPLPLQALSRLGATLQSFPPPGPFLLPVRERDRLAHRARYHAKELAAQFVDHLQAVVDVLNRAFAHRRVRADQVPTIRH